MTNNTGTGAYVWNEHCPHLQECNIISHARIAQSVKWPTMGWMTEVSTPSEVGIFLFATIVSRPALRTTQPPIQCAPATLSLGVKWPQSEAYHPPPSSAEPDREYAELHLLPPYMPSWQDAHTRGNFAFLLHISVIISN